MRKIEPGDNNSVALGNKSAPATQGEATAPLGWRLASATVHLTLSNVFVRLLSILSMPVLTHLLPPSAYGTAAMVGTLISLASVVALAGADASYIRAADPREPASAQATETFVWRFALASGTMAALAVLVFRNAISEIFALPQTVGWFIATGIVLSIAQAMSQARARIYTRHGAISVAIIASGVIATSIAIASAYYWRQDEVPLIISMLAGYLVPIFVLRSPTFPTLIKTSGLARAQRLDIIKIGLPALLTAPAYWVIASSDRWFLTYFFDIEVTGVYSVGYSVAIIGMMANNAVLTVWTPEAVKIYEKNSVEGITQLSKMTEGMIAGLALVWLAVVAAGGDLVTLLAAPPYHRSAIIIPFIAGAVFFHGVLHLANTIFLLTKNVFRTVPWWLLGAISCIFFNTTLIPYLEMQGAALSQLLSISIIAIGLTVKSREILVLNLRWTRLGLVFVAVCLFGTLMFQAWSNSPLYSLSLKFPLGVLLAILVGGQFGLLSLVGGAWTARYSFWNR